MLAILDYGAGNQTSVWRALQNLGIQAKITSNPVEIAGSSGVIFPGVGAAPQAMENLRQSGMDMELTKVVERGQPLLGICLGCQILLEKSEEGAVETLGIARGVSRRFSENWRDENGELLKIPHMGWNGLRKLKEDPLLAGIPEDAEFYFVHGYYVCPDESLLIAMTRYGIEFCSIYGMPGLWAVQFHPEKSGVPGLRILKNFNDYCEEKSGAFQTPYCLS